MFIQIPQIGHAYDDEAVLTYHARHLFAQPYAAAKLPAVGAEGRVRPAQLKSLATTLQHGAVIGRRYAGVRLIALDAIRSSADFDSSFRPRRRHMAQRWTRVASARMAGVVFAPVVLIQVGDDYFVRNGHHPLSLARAFGRRYIEAEITVWDVDSLPASAS